MDRVAQARRRRPGEQRPAVAHPGVATSPRCPCSATTRWRSTPAGRRSKPPRWASTSARTTGPSAATSSTSPTATCATSPPGTSPARTAAPLIQALQQELGGQEVAGGDDRVPPRRAVPQHPRLARHVGRRRRSPGRRRSRRTTSPTSRSPTTCRRGRAATCWCQLMEASKPILADHPVNQRRDRGGQEAGDADLAVGPGQGADGAAVRARRTARAGRSSRAVDLVRGVGRAARLAPHRRARGDRLPRHRLRRARAGTAVEALGAFDLVCVHVEAPDEASHEGKADEKVKALERIDEHIVGPLLDALPRYGDWRILVEPDHRTTLRTRAHAHGAVPFAVAGTGIAADGPDELRRADRRRQRPELRPGLAADAVVPGRSDDVYGWAESRSRHRSRMQPTRWSHPKHDRTCSTSRSPVSLSSSLVAPRRTCRPAQDAEQGRSRSAGTASRSSSSRRRAGKKIVFDPHAIPEFGRHVVTADVVVCSATCTTTTPRSRRSQDPKAARVFHGAGGGRRRAGQPEWKKIDEKVGHDPRPHRRHLPRRRRTGCSAARTRSSSSRPTG